jgi:hypothetical protein
MSRSNLTFEEWMKEIDRIVGQRFFISVYDLPDRLYRDMYDDGFLPDEVVMDIEDDLSGGIFDL